MKPRGCCWREMGRQDGSVHGGQALAPLQHPASGEPGSSGVAWHGRRRRRRRQRRQVTWKESGPRINAPRREGRSYQFERNSEVSRRAWFSVFRTNYSAYSGSLKASCCLRGHPKSLCGHLGMDERVKVLNSLRAHREAELAEPPGGLPEGS